jgi:hypothetical protein
MAKQGLIYSRPRPIAKSWHQDWYVDDTGGYGFASELSAVPIAVVELLVAAREYPVVFVDSQEGMTLLALLGLRDRQNLFVDPEGTWTGRYIPAFLRRYPFVLAKDDQSGNFTLCIDEASERCNTEGRGNALFDEKGEPSAYLNRMLDLSRDWERARMATQQFCERVKELELLETQSISMRGATGRVALSSGFSGVSRDKLKALSDQTAGELLRSGHLELIVAHLVSLGGIEALGARLPRAAA